MSNFISSSLVGRAQVMLIDEPTSGLDAHTALRTVELLRRIAICGRLVVVSLHQPSSQIFQLVDDLMLLTRGTPHSCRASVFHPSSPCVTKLLLSGWRPGDGLVTPLKASLSLSSSAVAASQVRSLTVVHHSRPVRGSASGSP